MARRLPRPRIAGGKAWNDASSRPIYYFDVIHDYPEIGGVVEYSKRLLSELKRLCGHRVVSARDAAAAIAPEFADRSKPYLDREAAIARALAALDPASMFVFPNFHSPVPRTETGSPRPTILNIVHDIQFKFLPEYFSQDDLAWLERAFHATHKNADQVLFVSETTRRHYHHHFGYPEREAVIYAPIPRSERASDADGAGRARYLLATGHYDVHPHKNFAGLLRFFARLGERDPDLRLVLTGHGRDGFGRWLGHLPQSLRDRIDHLGFVPPERLEGLYRGASAFVSLSRFEGFNMSAAEAACHGTPLLLSDLPAHRELFSEHALFLDGDTADLDEVARFIDKAPGSSAWAKAADCAPDRIAERVLGYALTVDRQRVQACRQPAAPASRSGSARPGRRIATGSTRQLIPSPPMRAAAGSRAALLATVALAGALLVLAPHDAWAQQTVDGQSFGGIGGGPGGAGGGFNTNGDPAPGMYFGGGGGGASISTTVPTAGGTPNGGTGGLAGGVGADAILGGSLSGGNGGAGGGAFGSYFGGGGGAGGYAAIVTGPANTTSSGTATFLGGQGGQGGASGPAGAGAAGGAGGVGIYLRQGGSLQQTSTVTGGSGGVGGNNGAGGFGGTALLTDTGFAATLRNSSNITGGAGAATGNTSGRIALPSGNGGTGVYLGGGGSVSNLAGAIAGGAGGAAAQVSGSGSYYGTAGAGGAGVVLAAGGTITSTNGATIAGGVGGSGTAPFGYFGGIGGAGGTGLLVNGAFTADMSGSVTGGVGGTGGSSPTIAQTGGIGGNAVTLSSTAAGTFDNHTTLTAGFGGNGGTDEGGNAAGNGANAGIGVQIGSANVTFTNHADGTIQGGTGGNGGNSFFGGLPGRGAEGGAGVAATAIINLTNAGSITGGNGGNGGTGLGGAFSAGAPPGSGGNGAPGIDVQAGGAVFNLVGASITGGNGGAAGAATDGIIGLGSPGIRFAGDGTVTTAGAIVGGTDNDGTQRNSVDFLAGTHTLTLQTGATFTGNAVVRTDLTGVSAQNTLNLDAASVGGTANLSQFLNFGHFTQVGAGGGDWTVSGAGTFTIDASVSAGRLSFAAGATINVPTFTLLGGVLSLSTNAPIAGVGTLAFNGGTLQVTGTTFTSLSNTIVWGPNGGGFDIAAAANTFTVPQSLTGGPLTKLGAGTLVLTGANTYSGGTTITGGTLVGSATSFGTGPITDNAALIINQPTDADFAPPISGTGSFTKQGAGRLNVTGNGTLSGPTTVAAGTLAVNGALSGSVVTVNSGATLAGNGTVGGIAALGGSTISPGNSIGQLNVNGNVSFVAGSTYAVEINAAGAGDKIVATGTATLTGGTVNVTAASGVYSPAARYTILTANGGVTGTFTNLVTTSNLAFLNPALGYDPKNVFIFFTQNGVGFGTVARTPNQNAAGGGIQGLGGGPLFAAVLSSTAANAQRAFDVGSGEIHASAATAQFITADLVRNAILDRLRGGFGTGVGYGPDPRFGPIPGTPSVPAAYSADLPGRRGVAPVPMTILDPQVFALWGLGFGSFGSTRTDGNAATLTRDTGGFLLAADVTLDGMYRFGIGGGYTNTNLDVVNRLSRGSIESGYGTVYFGATLGAFTARLGAEYAGNSLDLRRNVVFPGFADNDRGRYGSSTKQVFGEFAYRFGFGPGFLEPIVGASGVWLDRDRFTEAGGPAALFGPARGQALGTATVGVRGEYALGETSPFSLRGLLAYRRAYGDVVPTALLGFAAGTGQTFTIAGIPIDRNAFVAEAGVDWRVADGITVGLLYMGQVGPRAQDHGLKGDFVWKF